MADYKSGRAVVVGLLLFGAALAVIAVLGRPRISLRNQSPQEKPRLAVLPFRNLSGDPELEVVASDVTLAIGKAFRETGRVELLPLATAREFIAGNEGLEKTARSLGADYAIGGSVDENEDRIVVDAYLYRSTPEALWPERIEFGAAERSSIPRALALRMTDALRRRY